AGDGMATAGHPNGRHAHSVARGSTCSDPLQPQLFPCVSVSAVRLSLRHFCPRAGTPVSSAFAAPSARAAAVTRRDACRKHLRPRHPYPGRRYPMMRHRLLVLFLGLALAIGLVGVVAAAPYAPPSLSVVDKGLFRITLGITAGANGSPAGFTMQWMKKSDYD